ncbi:MAG TPA: hypothetical protein VD995_32580 [Azospirillum sp.]|nr:hypothetical protein [Azospirillum sp.]
MTPYTHHATERAQQRAVPPLVVNWLFDYGRVLRRGGADVYFFDRRSRRRLEREVGGVALRRLADLLDAYAVVADDGHVITVGRRYRPLRG